MANQKSSPGKFITALFGAGQLRREQRAANEDMGRQMDNWEDTKMKNPYAGVKNPYENLENVYEDATVNLKQAEFEKEQSQQSMANVMAGMQGAAGGSGVAGLAQVLANQGVKQAQQASMSIGAQEQANQQLQSQEASRIQGLEREGDLISRQAEMGKISSLMGMSADEMANYQKQQNLARHKKTYKTD